MDLLTAIREGNREELDAMLADDVVFYGPLSTYHGRDQVVDLLALLRNVIEDLSPTREAVTVGAGETLTFMKGHLEDEELDGVLIQLRDREGRITEVRMLFRPMGPLQKAVRRMARAMTEDA
jgi:ketosteroid isomerase-like protein